MNEIRDLLSMAHEHDTAARTARQSAGLLLGAAKAEMPAPEFAELVGALGLDRRSVSLLIEAGAGGAVRA